MTANGSMARSAREAASDARDLRDEIGRTADYARQAIPELADKAKSFISERSAEYREQGREAADYAGEQLENARHYVVDRVQERPLTATLAALGVGFLLGMVLTSGRRR
jgi:ElaB/YqjD/DUF883 family membrane-anchored ribosome-binding protein